MEVTEKLFNSNTLAFIGGFIGAMSHYIASVQVLLSIRVEALLDYTIHSLIGGLVMLAVKLFGDGLVYLAKRWMRKRINKKRKQTNG